MEKEKQRSDMRLGRLDDMLQVKEDALQKHARLFIAIYQKSGEDVCVEGCYWRFGE